MKIFSGRRGLSGSACAAGVEPTRVVARAVELAGMRGEAARLTAEVMRQNLKRAEELGCTGDEGLSDMRRGQSPTIQRGRYRGDKLSVDHVIPYAVVPELANVMANLELIPLRKNRAKGDKLGEPERRLGQRLRAAGLLSADGLRKLEEAVRATKRGGRRRAQGETRSVAGGC